MNDEQEPVSTRRRLSRAVRVVLALVAILALTGAAVGAPHALRRMQSFRVVRIEVRGTRYLPPHDVLRASGITRRSSVFDDFAPWITALEKHPLVASATVTRALPGTVRITITEATPIALLAGAQLMPIDAEGELLPLDPSRTDLDLPVLLARSATDSSTHIVLDALARIRGDEPALFGWISDAESVNGSLRLRLRSPAGVQALIPNAPDTQTLRELRLTLADLAARQDISRLAHVDARYRGQIVIRLTTAAAAI